MDQTETGREAIEVPEPTATAAKTQTDPRRMLLSIASTIRDAIPQKPRRRKNGTPIESL